MTRTVTWLLLACMTLVTMGCAANSKPQLVKADAAIYTAVKAISDVEITLARAGKLTPAQSLRINEALLPAAKLGLESTHALQQWKPGQMAPPQIQRLAKELTDLTKTIIEIVSDGPTKAMLLEKVALASSVVMTILSVQGVM